MIIEGKTHKYGDDIDTDVIIPARYLNTFDPRELVKYCLEDLDMDFRAKMKSGDILVAGKNFGCGSSREHAPIVLKAIGLSCVIAESFARIFYRNAINIGFPIIECDTKNITDGDILRVDLSAGKIINLTKNEEYPVAPFPPFMQQLIDEGGLREYTKKQIER